MFGISRKTYVFLTVGLMAISFLLFSGKARADSITCRATGTCSTPTDGLCQWDGYTNCDCGSDIASCVGGPPLADIGCAGSTAYCPQYEYCQCITPPPPPVCSGSTPCGSPGSCSAKNACDSCGSLPSGYGNSCTGSTSSANSCGATNPGSSGTIQCDGSCSGAAGTTPSNPSGYGNSCTGSTSSANSCGATNPGSSGTIQCDGSCSGAAGTTPSNPSGYGNSCTGSTSSANSCGMTNPGSNGTIQCNGTCSGSAGTTPSNALCGTCDDNNPCTNDGGTYPSCTHTNNSSSCNDGNSCTSGDTCSGGSCGGTNNPVNGAWSGCGASAVCAGASCGGTCTGSAPSCGTVTCSTNSQCSDGNSCTTDTCDLPGTTSSFCTNSAVSGSHLACNGSQACVSTANASSACSDSCSGNSCVTCSPVNATWSGCGGSAVCGGNSCGGSSTCSGSAPACGGSPDSASCVSMTLTPPQSTVAPGQAISATIVMKNVGTNTWHDDTISPTSQSYGFTSVPWGNSPFGNQWNVLPSHTIAPNATATFNVSGTAPAIPGNYNFDWQMLHSNVAWFGETCHQVMTVAVTPAPTTSLTVNTAFGSASNGGSVYTHGYNDTPNLTWSSTNSTSCSLTSNNSDSKSGTSGTNVAANALGNDSGSGKTWIYTLTCTGSGGNVSATANVVVPPAPTNVAANCPAPGTAATLSWTAPGFTHFYVRNIDTASPAVPVYYNEDYTGTTYAIPNGYAGSYNLVNPIVNHTYSMWIHSRAPNGAYSMAAGVNYSCQPNPCPAGNVTLSSSSINVGQTSTASAPAGWSGGSYSSSNSGVASVSGSTVTGVSGGIVQVSGSGWNAPGGATSCGLSNSPNLTVTLPPPTNLTFTCGSPGTNMHLAWNPVPGVDYYLVRIDNQSNGWNSGCLPSVNPGDHCNDSEHVTNTFYDFSSQSGAPYSVWVFASKNSTFSAATYINPNPQSCGVSVPTANIYATNYGSVVPTAGSVTTYNGGPTTLSWTSTNATSCTVSSNPVAGAWSGTSNAGVTTLGLGQPTTFTLSCTGPGGSASNSVQVNFPPQPVSASATCNAPGNQVMFNWSLVSGYTQVYLRMAPISDYWNCAAAGGSCVDNLPGNSLPVAVTPSTGYHWWIHTKDIGPSSTNTGAWSIPSEGTFTCTIAVGPPGGGGGGSVTVTKLTCPATGVHLSWSAGTRAASYNIYRSTHGQAAALLTTVGNVLTYDDTTASGNNDYWVQSVGDATKVPADQNTTGISPNTCGGPGPATVTFVVPSSACGTLQLYWSAVVGASSYNIYRNTTGIAPTLGVTAPTYTGKPLATAASPYNDSGSLVVGQTYYYWVSGVVSVVESSVTAGGTGGGPTQPVGFTACVANLLTSDKDIMAINGVDMDYNPVSAGNQPPQACNSTTDSLPTGTALQSADKLKFQINLCNTGSAPATGISVSDTLTNLVMPPLPDRWKAQYNGTALTYSTTPTNAIGSYYSSGISPNQTLTFNLSTAPYNVAGPGTNTLTLEALLLAPANTSGTTARMQNCFNISYSGTGTGSKCTPLLPFYIGRAVPTIKEVP